MRTIILASNNEHKIIEFNEMFKDCKILSLKDIGFFDDIEENGLTFLDNAKIKAEATKKYITEHNILGDIIADDSGLCVNSLNGEPGVYSARYAGGHGNFEECRRKLIENMKGKKDRTAYFCCTIAIITPSGKQQIFVGKTYGEITDKEIGENGFGYDCIFYSDDLKKTFGEASEEEKNSVSHRSRALEKIQKEQNIWEGTMKDPHH